MNQDERLKFISERLKEHYDFLKSSLAGNDNSIVGVFLQGSQNYGMDIYDDDYQSDVDTKAIVLPSFENILTDQTQISTTLITSRNEHIDVKDIKTMFDNIKKQNINFVEILFTKYFIVNPNYQSFIDDIRSNAELIVHADQNKTVRSIIGMASEKFNALKHPYPSIIEKIDRFGYDPKQLHHLFRLTSFLDDFINGIPYRDCLEPDEETRDILKLVKKGSIPLEDAENLGIAKLKIIKDAGNKYLETVRPIDYDSLKKLDTTLLNLKKVYFRKYLLKEDNDETC